MGGTASTAAPRPENKNVGEHPTSSVVRTAPRPLPLQRQEDSGAGAGRQINGVGLTRCPASRERSRPPGAPIRLGGRYWGPRWTRTTICWKPTLPFRSVASTLIVGL